MFTGIITNFAKLVAISKKENEDYSLKLLIENSAKINSAFKIGCSISCNGICLTLISKQIFGINFNCESIFSKISLIIAKTFNKPLLIFFQASQETINKTNILNWQKNSLINIEFALNYNDEFGGHFVTGHIDETIKINQINKINQS